MSPCNSHNWHCNVTGNCNGLPYCNVSGGGSPGLFLAQIGGNCRSSRIIFKLLSAAIDLIHQSQSMGPSKCIPKKVFGYPNQEIHNNQIPKNCDYMRMNRS